MTQVMPSALQVPSADHLQLQAQSTDSFLNLLLLADSSLEDPSRPVDQQESLLSYNEEPEDVLVSMADESRLSASSNHQSSEPDFLANGGHHTVAGIACLCCSVRTLEGISNLQGQMLQLLFKSSALLSLHSAAIIQSCFAAASIQNQQFAAFMCMS